ncbi:hypothetical protein BV898_19284 [Hypsibius exemplaris]|uniref:Uncharacterized protein n=1 Tax=Hypsibius exemplaris TaxID=2072580 RepID=A0A9X6RPB3_HYPEX|nr:hypothetical protein BV898_19284 [Hypsibius exemplaris]
MIVLRGLLFSYIRSPNAEDWPMRHHRPARCLPPGREPTPGNPCSAAPSSTLVHLPPYGRDYPVVGATIRIQPRQVYLHFANCDHNRRNHYHAFTNFHHHLFEKSGRKGISVSYKTILRVIKSDEEENIPSKKKVKNVNKRGLPFIRSDNLIKQNSECADTPNPPIQGEISCKLGISTGTVSRVLKEDLGQTYHKKATTHVLTPKQAQQRLDRGSHFLRCLSRRKLSRIVSIDET